MVIYRLYRVWDNHSTYLCVVLEVLDKDIHLALHLAENRYSRSFLE